MRIEAGPINKFWVLAVFGASCTFFTFEASAQYEALAPQTEMSNAGIPADEAGSYISDPAVGKAGDQSLGENPVLSSPAAFEPEYIPIENQPPAEPPPVEDSPEYIPIEAPAAEEYIPIEAPSAEEYIPIEAPLMEEYIPIENPAAEEYIPIESPLAEEYIPIESPLAEEYIPIE